MDIRHFVIEETALISEAVKKMDENGQGVIFICKENCLVGVLSDGDFRRYILKQGELTKEVRLIANVHPKTLTMDEQKTAVQFMKENKITAVPIINAQRQILKIYFLDGKVVSRHMEKPVPVVIMAGGKGTRLSPYTNILPKPLIPIGEKTITEHIMERFENVGCENFCMIVNYKKNLIKAFFQENDKRVEFVDEEKFLGTGGGLKLLEGKFQETFFVSNCDILIDADYNDMLEYHKKSKNIITMVCAEKKETLDYGTVEINEKSEILELKEKPRFSFLINTGLYILEPEFLQEIPEGEFIHITDLIQQCIEKGKKVGAYRVCEDSWLDMGQLDALNQMKNQLDMH